PVIALSLTPADLDNAELVLDTRRLATTMMRFIKTAKLRPQLFARPCPVRPRHGFVDSRKVKAFDPDVINLLKESWAEDPDAELLLTPYIPAEFSGVWRPGLLVLGPGHDGATSGHSSIAVPLPWKPGSNYRSICSH